MPLSDAPKVTFQLTAHAERLEVRASAPGGEGKAETNLPPPDLFERLREYETIPIPSSLQKSIGQSLYRCLLPGEVANLAAEALQEGIRLGQPAQFELRLDADQVSLAQYPWEMLANELDQFLVRDGLVDLTRYLNYPQPPPSFEIKLDQMLLLQVVAQAANSPLELPVTKSETLHPATFDQLLRKLLIERLVLWGVQFAGEGALLPQCPKCEAINLLPASVCRQCKSALAEARQVSVLAFAHNGEVDWVSTKEFGAVLFNAKVQLALLLASETAWVENQLVFNSLTPSLLLSGVPAVVGMQYPVSNEFAASFAHIFYTSLLEQNDLLAALRTARSLHMRGPWYNPVLYLRHQRLVKPVEPLQATYHTRSIDTAAPAQVQAGVDFLVRLWIRRPETRPLSEAELRTELDVPQHVPVRVQQIEADLRFEPIATSETEPRRERKLRRGEVEVRLTSTRGEVTPNSIKLFVDEDLDAPPAIFTVRAREVGRMPLFFSLWQDGGQIAFVSHHLEALDPSHPPQTKIDTNSHVVPVEDEPPELLPQEHLRNLIRDRTRYLQKLKERQARQGLETPPGVLLEIEDLEAEIANLQKELKDSKEVEESPVEIPEETEPFSLDELERGAEPEAPPPVEPPVVSKKAVESPPSAPGPPPSPDKSTKQTIGPYEIVKKIGHGGAMGLYKAYQPDLDRYVTIRVYPRHEVDWSQFQRQAEAVTKLHHPHLISIIDVGQEGDQVYLVTEYVEGFSLQDTLKAQPLSMDQAMGVVEQLAGALDYAHRQGVVHGQVKPANIFLKDGQQVLLTDLGLTQITQTQVGVTKSGAMGTPAYLSPEQARGEATDTRADVYALGVILYEMLTGHTPHEAESPLATLVKRVNEPPLSPRSLNPHVPVRVEQVILKALAINPVDRYASAGELAAALRQAWDQEVVSLPPRPIYQPSMPSIPPFPPSTIPSPPILAPAKSEKRLTSWQVGPMIVGIIITLLLLLLIFWLCSALAN